MKTTRKWISGFILLGYLIYVLSPGTENLIDNPTGWEVREQVVFLTGSYAMALMVLSMIISVRFKPVNRLMGGLDKAYVVHKWTGIFASVFGVLHWLMEYGASALVLLNIIPDPGELGDFTNRIKDRIRIGESVEVEGPYGQFTFDDHCGKQVWIAGGIGITPFMARLEHLANRGDSDKPVDFWYCTRGTL